jgi:hypothetical protein
MSEAFREFWVEVSKTMIKPPDLVEPPTDKERKSGKQ